MRHFAAFLLREQPRIAKAVDALAAELPGYVRPAAAYALSTGGKRLRPALTVLCARALGYNGDDIYRLGATVEMFHVATLLHDDILDNADTRRSHLATHLKFGVPRTLLSADAMVACAFKALADTNDPRFMRCLTSAVIGTADGEIMEIENQGSTTGGIEQYTSIIEGKTACLLRASCELGALCAGADEKHFNAISTFGRSLGMAFQIADDALDFSPESVTGKPEGGDLREGKYTPPIAFYTESLTDAARQDFLKKFTARSFSDADVSNIVHEIREKGFQDRTLRLADSYLNTASAALHSLDTCVDNTASKACATLAEAIDFVRDRTA